MSQNSLSRYDGGGEVDRNRKQVAIRLRQIYTCLDSLSLQNKPIPEEAAIEIQHALSHLALISDTESHEQKTRRWHQALAHLNRAVIDLLKVFILNVLPQHKFSVEFLEKWLRARQKEYREHASGTQSPGLLSTTERELFTIENYAKLLNFSINISSLDFREEDLKGDVWRRYLIELDNWMNSDLMLGGLKGKKDADNLAQLLKTLWTLDADALAKCNIEIQKETLIEAGKLGVQNNWSVIYGMKSI